MKKPVSNILLCLIVFVFSCGNTQPSETEKQYTTNEYQDLVTLFKEWRAFEKPPQLDGAPDYTAETFNARMKNFETLRSRLNTMDTSGWSIPNQVDWMVVWAEMNGFDFNHKTLKPWVRDPAYYKSVWTAKSDVPAHELTRHIMP